MTEATVLTFSEAEKLLPEGEHIHTFVQVGPMLVGADWDREDIVELMNRAPILVTGPGAQKMGHGLACFDGEKTVFIESRSYLERKELLNESKKI